MFSSLQYAMQILFAVFMVTAMFVMLPRASASAARISEVLDLEPEIAEPSAGTAAAGRRRGRPRRIPERHFPVSRRRGTGAHGRVVHGASRRGHGDRRRHRLGKIDTRRAHPALLRRHRRAGYCSTASTCATWPRPICARASGSCRRPPCSSPGPSPPTSATAARTRPTTRCAMPRRWRRPSTSSRRCRSSSRHRSRRAASTCRAGRSSACRLRGPSSGGPTSTSSTTASRRSTSPPTPGCAPHCGPKPPTPRCSSSRSASARSSPPTASSSSTRGASSASARHAELLKSSEIYREIVASQVSLDEVA